MFKGNKGGRSGGKGQRTSNNLTPHYRDAGQALLRQGYGGQANRYCWNVKLLGIGLAAMVFCAAGCGISRPYHISVQKQAEFKIEKPQPKLKVGEKFTYKAEWLGMDVGKATLLVKEITEMNGRQVYHVMAIAETTSFVSKLYKVEDIISTYIDVNELYPVRFDKKQREGGHRSDGYLDFYQDKGKAFYFSRLTNEKKEFDVPQRVQDPLSCIYYYRLSNVKAGEIFSADINLNDKNWFLQANVIDKGIVKIEGIGEWKAFMAEPLPWFQGKLTRKAKVSIWFSADDDRIPLLVITSGIPFVGTVTITLQKIEYLEDKAKTTSDPGSEVVKKAVQP